MESCTPPIFRFKLHLIDTTCGQWLHDASLSVEPQLPESVLEQPGFLVALRGGFWRRLFCHRDRGAARASEFVATGAVSALAAARPHRNADQDCLMLCDTAADRRQKSSQAVSQSVTRDAFSVPSDISSAEIASQGPHSTYRPRLRFHRDETRM